MLSITLGILAIVFLILWLNTKYKNSGSLESNENTKKELEQSRKNNSNLELHNQAYLKELESLKLENFNLERKLLEAEKNSTLNTSEHGADVNDVIDNEKSDVKAGRLPFFEMFTDERDNFRWRFKAKNNKIVADSGEGYTTKQNLKKGMHSFMSAIISGQYNAKWSDGNKKK